MFLFPAECDTTGLRCVDLMDSIKGAAEEPMPRTKSLTAELKHGRLTTRQITLSRFSLSSHHRARYPVALLLSQKSSGRLF